MASTSTNWGDLFSYKSMQELAKYLTSYNMGSQTLALDANANDIQSTGTGAAMINGIFIPSLAADAALDISADNAGDATGVSIANLYQQYFVVLATADGTLSVWKAGSAALTATGATLKIPAFDPATYCCVGTMLVTNDSGSAIVIGTTALTGDVTFVNITGPVFPHPDNFDKN